MTNKELIRFLSQYPDDATITMLLIGLGAVQCKHAQYNEFGNEIILDNGEAEEWDPSNSFDQSDIDLIGACGIW